jgi:hypothetical protein
VTVEAMHMLEPATTATADPIWMMRLRVDPADPTGQDELRRMDELMRRTGGVCSSGVVAGPVRLGVTLGLAAPDPVAAVTQARALVTSCARRAGVGEVAIDGVEVT